jgi:hypothetical protein
MNRSPIHSLSVSTFAKAVPVLLLVSALSLCPLQAAPLSLFDSGYKWQARPDKSRNAQGAMSQDTVENSNAVILNYDFSNAEDDAGMGLVADKDVDIQEGDGPIRFRVKASSPFQMQVYLTDTNGTGHSLIQKYDQIGEWAEVVIPLEYGAFTSHIRGEDPELAKTITFPIVSVGFYLKYKPSGSMEPQGTITFSDFPKK